MKKTSFKAFAITAMSLHILTVTPVNLVQAASEPVVNTCRTTAYYSPLPDQSYYVMGDYEAEMRMNGRGVAGADGTPVFPGMLAAPSTYSFGTHIYLPGLGMGAVHDRGGAIVQAGERGESYDRIDIWMGHGEEGLNRALNWGSRTIECQIYYDSTGLSTDLDFSSVDANLSSGYVDKLVANTTGASRTDTPAKPVLPALPTGPVFNISPGSENVVFVVEDLPELPSIPKENEAVLALRARAATLTPGLGGNSLGEPVSNLQLMLSDLGYFKGHVNGVYDDATTEAVFALQLEHQVLSLSEDLGAGYYGYRTHQALLEQLETHIESLSAYPRVEQMWIPSNEPLPQISSLSLPEMKYEHSGLVFADSLMNKNSTQEKRFTYEMQLYDRNDQVIELQMLLMAQGLLSDGTNTGYYGEVTAQAVTNFQLSQGIIANTSDPEAGRVGQRTLDILNLL